MKAKLIIKGVLLHVTTLVTALWLCGIESIMDKGYFIPWTLTMAVLIYICYKCISYREFYVISLSRWFDNILKG